jgi:hypothetical protein
MGKMSRKGMVDRMEEDGREVIFMGHGHVVEYKESKNSRKSPGKKGKA